MTLLGILKAIKDPTKSIHTSSISVYHGIIYLQRPNPSPSKVFFLLYNSPFKQAQLSRAPHSLVTETENICVRGRNVKLVVFQKLQLDFNYVLI
jgi:hypothetical protein